MPLGALGQGTSAPTGVGTRTDAGAREVWSWLGTAPARLLVAHVELLGVRIGDG